MKFSDFSLKIFFLQSHCILPHFELNYTQSWPYFQGMNSRAGNLFLLISGRGRRSQEDTKIQSEKEETALYPKADARFFLILSARSQQVLSTLHSPWAHRILPKSCQCQQSAFH